MWESPSGGGAAAAGSTGALTGCPFARGSTAPVGALLPAAGAVAEGFEPLPPPAPFAWCFDPVARDAPPPVVDVAVGIGLVVGAAEEASDVDHFTDATANRSLECTVTGSTGHDRFAAGTK